jgi:hypothetical protein
MQLHQLPTLTRFILCCAALVASGTHAEILDFSDNPSSDPHVGTRSGAYKLTGGQGTPYTNPVFEVSGTSVTLIPAAAPGKPTIYLVRDKPAWPDYRYLAIQGADVGVSWAGDPADRPADWKNELVVTVRSYMMSERFTFSVGGIDQLTHIVVPSHGLSLALSAPEGGILRVANIDVWPNSPVPEPSTYAMMLAGLGLIGFVARKKGRQSTSIVQA